MTMNTIEIIDALTPLVEALEQLAVSPIMLVAQW
jgi:hypothetical protein